MSIVFGRDTICPRCRKRDRRKLPYATGTIEMSRGMAKSLGRKIVRSYGPLPTDTVLVECVQCGGKGFITT